MCSSSSNNKRNPKALEQPHDGQYGWSNDVSGLCLLTMIIIIVLRWTKNCIVLGWVPLLGPWGLGDGGGGSKGRGHEGKGRQGWEQYPGRMVHR